MSADTIFQTIILLCILESFMPAIAPKAWKKTLEKISKCHEKKIQYVAFFILCSASITLMVL